MGKPEECVGYLKSGYYPPEIAVKMGISLGSVRKYLYLKVGEGVIKRSDIFFSFPSTFRSQVESVIQSSQDEPQYTIERKLKESNIPIDRETLKFYYELRDAGHALSDMYDALREIEVKLHTLK